MDRKTIPIVIACFVLLILWSQLVNKIYPPIPKPVATNVVATASATATNVAAPATPTAPAPAVSTTNAPKRTMEFRGEEETLVLTNENARYTFTSHGGGL